MSLQVSFGTRDGASDGILPERALDTILGGAPPPGPEEKLSREELRAWILAAPERDATTYNEAAAIVARGMLAFAGRHPEIARPLNVDRFIERWEALEPGVWKALCERALGPTAFQVGWAYNAVRSLLGYLPSGNPALAEFGAEEDLDGGQE